MGKFDALKKTAYQCNIDLPKYGLVLFTFGNVSAIDRDAGVIAIKPSGVDYNVLKPDDMVVLNLEGEVLEGEMNPSSDTKTHLVLYNQFANIGGIVHTHSTYATAWAQAGRAIPVLGTTHADHLHQDVPCTRIMQDDKIKGDYEVETGHQILDTFESMNPDEVEMVLVAGHGPFTWGKTVEKAVYNAVVLEELARMALFTKQVNPSVTRIKDSLIQKHYQRKHGPDATYGQKDSE